MKRSGSPNTKDKGKEKVSSERHAELRAADSTDHEVFAPDRETIEKELTEQFEHLSLLSETFNDCLELQAKTYHDYEHEKKPSAMVIFRTLDVSLQTVKQLQNNINEAFEQLDEDESQFVLISSKLDQMAAHCSEFQFLINFQELLNQQTLLAEQADQLQEQSLNLLSFDQLSYIFDTKAYVKQFQKERDQLLKALEQANAKFLTTYSELGTLLTERGSLVQSGDTINPLTRVMHSSMLSALSNLQSATHDLQQFNNEKSLEIAAKTRKRERFVYGPVNAAASWAFGKREEVLEAGAKTAYDQAFALGTKNLNKSTRKQAVKFAVKPFEEHGKLISDITGIVVDAGLQTAEKTVKPEGEKLITDRTTYKPSMRRTQKQLKKAAKQQTVALVGKGVQTGLTMATTKAVEKMGGVPGVIVIEGTKITTAVVKSVAGDVLDGKYDVASMATKAGKSAGKQLQKDSTSTTAKVAGKSAGLAAAGVAGAAAGSVLTPAVGVIVAGGAYYIVDLATEKAVELALNQIAKLGAKGTKWATEQAISQVKFMVGYRDETGKLQLKPAKKVDYQLVDIEPDETQDIYDLIEFDAKDAAENALREWVLLEEEAEKAAATNPDESTEVPEESSSRASKSAAKTLNKSTKVFTPMASILESRAAMEKKMTESLEHEGSSSSIKPRTPPAV